MRSVADIEADIKAADQRRSELAIELVRAMDAEMDRKRAVKIIRNRAILAAFDAGTERKVISADFRISQPALGRLLMKHHRSNAGRRQQQVEALSAGQQREYRRLMNRGGIGWRAALQVAQSLSQQETDHGRQGNSSTGPERVHATG